MFDTPQIIAESTPSRGFLEIHSGDALEVRGVSPPLTTVEGASSHLVIRFATRAGEICQLIMNTPLSGTNHGGREVKKKGGRKPWKLKRLRSWSTMGERS